MTSPATARLEGRRGALRAERALRRRIFRPPPTLTVSEWADRHRVLSRVASAEPGKWRTDRAPYQRGIMDAFSDPAVDEVVVMSSAQIGKTEILLNVVGYFVDQDPAPILLMEPTLDMARAFSTDRLKTMLMESPQLRGKVHESARRHSGDTILHKEFPGGHLTMVGANSAAGLSSRPIRVVLADEVDRYPASAGDEGDPVSLADKRTATFWNRKKAKFSTPTVKGVSRIERAYVSSDQRRYLVPCPECGHEQPLAWANLHWDKDEHGKPKLDTVRYACAGCGVLLEEQQKYAMLLRGRWHAEKPFGGIAGFFLNALYSPWATWAELVREFDTARRSPETLRVFVNTVLGETWEMDGEAVDTTALEARRERYLAEVPNDVGILTAGVDVQRDRLELVVKGWGAGQESWLIAHHRVAGDPSKRDVWDRLDLLLLKERRHESGQMLAVRSCCIDSGDLTQDVYAFVRPRQRRGVHATKGHSVRGKPLVNRPGKPNKYGIKVVPIGTDTAKDVVFARLKNGEPGSPGYMHFPFPQPDGADDEYFAQFGAEKAFTKRVKGIPVREYRAVRDRNEAIDLEVLALAALHLLGAAVYDQLAVWVERVRQPVAAPPAEPAKDPTWPVDQMPQPAPPRVMPGPKRPPGMGYIDRWRK